MKSTSRKLYAVGSLLSLGLLVSCGGGGSDGDGSDGTLSMKITDAPCDFQEVNVTVTKVRVHKAENAEATGEGWEEIVLSEPKKINLLKLTNGLLADLGQTSLPAGTYTQVRLVLAKNDNKDPFANSIKLDNTTVALDTPSAHTSGLKAKADNGPFVVAAGVTTEVTLDFDACRSVVKKGKGNGGYSLKPVITIIPMATSGQIVGSIDLTGITAAQALVSAQVNGKIIKSTVPHADGTFILAPVPAGNYSVVVAANTRASAVVTEVPVTANTDTALNTTPIQLSPSTEKAVTGIVKPFAIGAVAEARQTFGIDQTVTIRYQNVEADTGIYSLTLPVAAPKFSKYTSSELIFEDKTSLAGKYTIHAVAEGYKEASKEVDVSGVGTTEDFTLVKQ